MARKIIGWICIAMGIVGFIITFSPSSTDEPPIAMSIIATVFLISGLVLLLKRQKTRQPVFDQNSIRAEECESTSTFVQSYSDTTPITRNEEHGQLFSTPESFSIQHETTESLNVEQQEYYPEKITKALFLNWIGKGKTIGREMYPQYFLYECGIKNCQEYHEKLLYEGYLTKPDVKDMLSYLKVVELKNILKGYGLSQSGNKRILIDRIIASVPNTDLRDMLSHHDIYVLSEQGKAYIDDNYDYIELRKLGADITFQEYDEEKAMRPSNFKFNDIVWGILNKRILSYSSSMNLGLLRNTYLKIAQIVMKEGRDTDALSFLLIILYLDLNIDNCKIDALSCAMSREDYEDLFIEPILAPFVVNNIITRRHLLTQEMFNRCYRIRLPYLLLTHQEFWDLVNQITSSQVRRFEDLNLSKYTRIIK